jgi:glycosyltransferase involved in cell wall biosynthesis
MNAVHIIVPAGIDDPARPSGGNVYDRKICDGLAEIGWSVHEHALPGDWPRPDGSARHCLTVTLGGLADNAIVLIDGLIASGATDLPALAQRLRVVVLVHMPVGQEPARAETRVVEQAALSAAAGVVATSAWTKGWLVEQYALEPDRIHVAPPGTDAAELSPGTPDGGGLLCVAAVTSAKGHDLLVAALAQVAGLSWDCVCVGPLGRDPAFVDRLRLETFQAGISDRIRFVGPRGGDELDMTYAAADVVIVSSRSETYGMVVTEALARGIPVIAAAVGGVPEALGYGTFECGALEHGPLPVVPGILIPPGDANVLAAALRSWLGDTDLRSRLRTAARQRRGELSDWATTCDRLSAVLVRAGA